MTFWYIAVALLLDLHFHPPLWLLALYRDWRAARQREQVEDALKHLLDREQGGRHASPESLAGTLDLPRVKTTTLIASMESQELVESRGSELHLTPKVNAGLCTLSAPTACGNVTWRTKRACRWRKSTPRPIAENTA